MFFPKERFMPRHTLALLMIGCLALPASAMAPPATSTAEPVTLAAAIASPTRTAANVARDKYRHPAETLAFFGVKPGDTLVEITPGGGWYTEILAPYIASGGGTYIAAASDRGLSGVRKLMAAQPAAFAKVQTANFPILAPAGTPVAPTSAGTPVAPGSADVVLTFRNIHNWMMADTPYEAEAFKQMYAMLKPGGTLGVAEHRLPESADDARQLESGYVKVSTARRLAEAAGFKLVAASEINAHPRDTADHPKGVWTLPPTYRLGDVDRAKYAAIGESDRMTLKFVKPR
jgi:predicted methyltransferase